MRLSLSYSTLQPFLTFHLIPTVTLMNVPLIIIRLLCLPSPVMTYVPRPALPALPALPPPAPRDGLAPAHMLC